MNIIKLKEILKIIFLWSPYLVVASIGQVLLYNRKLADFTLEVVKITKPKKKIDKDKFNNFMKRITK